MKIKYFFAVIFALALFPMFANALDKNYCDNNVYEDYYRRFAGKNLSPNLKWAMGERHDRGKYIKEMLAYCADPNRIWKCDHPRYGTDRDPKIEQGFGYEFRDMAAVNMPTFALLLNNKPLFEALITEGGYGYLLDNGIYKIAEDLFNDEFLTQAFQAVKEGQVGVLEYLIENYDANLLKLVGSIYRYHLAPQTPVDVKAYAKRWLEEYQRRGNYEKVECMVAVQKVIEDWYQKNAHKKKYIEEAERYNKILLEWAPKYKVKNEVPLEFVPMHLPDVFRLNIEQNYAQNIENQIDVLMEKIMQGFDLSNFGNKA